MALAKIGMWTFVLWMCLLGLVGLLHWWATTCDSEDCTGTFFVTIAFLVLTAFAGVIVVPIGVISGLVLLRKRTKSQAS